MVTAGALSAASIVAEAFTSPGDRVLVESPVYPNATQALRHGGAADHRPRSTPTAGTSTRSRRRCGRPRRRWPT